MAAPEAFFGDRIAHFFIHRAAHDFVEIALAAFKLGSAQHDALRRQFARHLILATTQQKGFDAARQ